MLLSHASSFEDWSDVIFAISLSVEIRPIQKVKGFPKEYFVPVLFQTSLQSAGVINSWQFSQNGNRYQSRRLGMLSYILLWNKQDGEIPLLRNQIVRYVILSPPPPSPPPKKGWPSENQQKPTYFYQLKYVENKRK